MKKLALAIMTCAAVFAFAQDKTDEPMKPEQKSTVLHGYVVDQMCAKSIGKKTNPMERAAKHDKDCALEEACAASGYGLFYDNGKWVKFDEKGDKLAREMFATTKKDNGFAVDVTGEMSGDKLAVASLTESKMTDSKMKSDETKKPAKKVETQEDLK